MLIAFRCTEWITRKRKSFTVRQPSFLFPLRAFAAVHATALTGCLKLCIGSVLRRLPWDAEQTHESLRSSLLEETYEVLDALDSNDMTALEEELGDLLLQIVFHSVIEEECQRLHPA